MSGAQSIIYQALHGVTLIKDSVEADSCGVLCSLLKQAMQAGTRVHLLGAEYPKSHYVAVLKKLGMHLRKDSPMFSGTDLLKTGDLSDPDCLAETIKICLRQSHKQGLEKNLIVIDSLSSLYSFLGDSAARILDLVDVATAMILQSKWKFQKSYSAILYSPRPARMRFLKQVVDSKRATSVILVAHEDIPDDSLWISVVEHSVDTVVTLEALPVGKAADVQMRLRLFRPNRWGYACSPEISPDTVVSLYDELFARVSERSVVLQQGAQ